MVITGNNKAQHSKLSKLASPNYQQLQLDASHRGALSREEAERKQRVPFVAAFPILKLSGTDPCTPQAPSHPIPSHPIPAQPSQLQPKPNRVQVPRWLLEKKSQGQNTTSTLQRCVAPLFLPQPPNKHEAFIPHRGHSCLLNRVCRCLEQRRSVNYVHYPLFVQWPLDSFLPNPPRTCQ